ncbi:GNAT family N-acetyltransferase [Gilvimarinus sp. SDUM040013]|uniref:GNAT family N-acetyltransferase n=1 Tax=Gilvimarinus gilvus TaxID=3058038 RepID=A0ABU4S2G4_9GAMM|nr:GNAT family N-acetyltransferase [Gilvimarinus sp. SDUM040013]MDO3388756.1 GNAT family N-acetyltransferase [Gilvimarinus sp. SDUM040013]MDX6851369.1 GNAT family N-acetyltransferase [Gilvimarinus sp. SDUM040013]
MIDLTSPPLRFVQAQWGRDSQQLCDIRKTVFIDEQGVSEDEEWDGKDQSARHFCVEYCAKPQPSVIGCARIVDETWRGNRGLHIGRVAVIKNWRKQGVGRYLMSSMLDWCAAPRRSQCPVFLHSQIDAMAFYQKLGFEPVSDEFMDAGIPHRTMLLNK